MMKRIACSIFFSAFCLLGFFASARASQNYVVNGTTYTFPDVDDVDWGQNVTDWAGAVSAYGLYKNGGNFFITSDINFGQNFGLKSKYFSSISTPTASTGTIRLGAGDSITWFQNSSTNTLSIDQLNRLRWQGQILSTITVNSDAIDTSTNTQTKAGSLVSIGSMTASYFVGSGTYLTDLQAANVTGNLSVNNFNNGTNASLGTILRGDGTWGSLVDSSTSDAMFNLFITTNGSDTNQIVVSADFLNVQGIQVVGISTTCALNKLGAGGTDIAEQASILYNIFVVVNSSTNAVGVIASSQTIPSPFPANFNKWRRIGSIENDSSANIVPIYKHNNVVGFWTPIIQVFSADLSTTEAVTDFSGHIPLSAENLTANIYFQPDASGVANTAALVVFPTFQNPENTNFYSFYLGCDAYSDRPRTSTRVISLFGSNSLHYREISHILEFYLIILGYTDAY